MSLIHPSIVDRLKDPKIQNLAFITLTLGAISSVAGYWLWDEIAEKPRTPPSRAIAKGLFAGTAYLAYKAWVASGKLEKGVT